MNLVPEVTLLGTKRTLLVNHCEICKSLAMTPAELMTCLAQTFTTECDLIDNHLYIKGRYSAVDIKYALKTHI